ncbi:DNA topology modulation protein [Paenibacillus chitinolyticus]|uniref:DNA topology modulation protein n=1 Tax=Paenibacillus chitinolyticus TaxID=79263 RepID=UPI00364B3817
MKLLLIGPGGSGKSTFARELGEKLELPLYHLDAYYWKPGWVPTPNGEWDEFIGELIREPAWIMDGNYARTLEMRLKAADVVIFFDLPSWLVVYRVIKRRIMYHNRTRPDLNEGCPEQLDWDFVKWVWNFRKHKRPQLLKQLENCGDNVRVFIVKNGKDKQNILEELLSLRSFV